MISSVSSKSSRVECIVDLGFGVLDSATVEVACYVIKNVAATATQTPVARLLATGNKEEELQSCLADRSDKRWFIFRIDECGILPLSPWIYWVSTRTLGELAKHETLEPKAAVVRQGLGTGDNNRFIRALWEVPPELIASLQANFTEFAGEFNHGKRWAFHVRSGSSQPWYSPLTVLIDWENQGARLKELWRSKGENPSRYIPSEELYFRPGFSWTRRAFRLIPYVIPLGCIPSASRYMAFPATGTEFSVLGLAASNVASSFMRFYGEMFERPNHLVDTLKRLPYVAPTQALAQRLAEQVRHEVARRRAFFRNFEPYLDFVVPAAIKQWADDDSTSWNGASLLGHETDLEVAKSLGLCEEQLSELESDLNEAIQVRRRVDKKADGDEEEDGDDDSKCDVSPRGKFSDILSYSLGCIFGRWDIRFGTGEKPVPQFPDPFAPLPVCPPGMLQGAEGLPLSPEEGRQLRAMGQYPLDVAWDGILVDDQERPLDVDRRVREALAVLFGARADVIAQEAYTLLGANSLRDWFRKPTGFFAEHLARYTKSKRKAPIYWPLSTASGSYTLWLYYPRLTSETLFCALKQFVEPKLSEIEKALAHLRPLLAAEEGAARERRQLEELETLRRDLSELRAELEAWAPRWKPNLNDGVLITASPLWKLFRHPKWRKDLEACWRELERGAYDWSHLALTLWPARVRESCKSDRSLAIAHGLEELCEVEAPKPKAKRRAKPDAAAKEREAKKEALREELTEALSIILLGEKIPLDVTNAHTGEVIIPANRKITKTLLRKIASAYDQVDIAPSPIHNKIREIITLFEARLAKLQLTEQQEMTMEAQ